MVTWVANPPAVSAFFFAFILQILVDDAEVFFSAIHSCRRVELFRFLRQRHFHSSSVGGLHGKVQIFLHKSNCEARSLIGIGGTHAVWSNIRQRVIVQRADISAELLFATSPNTGPSEAPLDAQVERIARCDVTHIQQVLVAEFGSQPGVLVRQSPALVSHFAHDREDSLPEKRLLVRGGGCFRRSADHESQVCRSSTKDTARNGRLDEGPNRAREEKPCPGPKLFDTDFRALLPQ